MNAAGVLVIHAADEQQLAETLAAPLVEAGYVVSHRGRVAVGASIVEETSKLLSAGVQIVLCATAKAVGTTWCNTVVHAARSAGSPVLVVQMEPGVHVETISFGQEVARYWEDPELAISRVKEALGAPTPCGEKGREQDVARARYRHLALKAVDIIDLAGLPELDRNIALRQLELRRLYVPLRVRSEAGPEDPAPGAKIEEIEERRHQEMRGGQLSEVGQRSPLGERLRASRRIVVLGDPGAGKTTVIRWLATAYLLRLHSDPDHQALPDVASLPDEDLLPIIIRCRDLDAEALAGSLEDMLWRTLRKSEIAAAEAETLMAAFRSDLTAGRALLLVDGLDEIQDPAHRATFCAQLERIHVAYPEAWIVATSRIVGYREMGVRIGRGFEHVTIADLSRDDKDLFAGRWCALTEPSDRQERATAELIKDIHSADRIERLTGNPMLLTTMALVKRKVGKLPDGRAELYGDAVDVLLRWRHEIDEAIDHREALPQLQYIAYAMCERGVQQLREEEVLGLLEQMREDYPSIRALRQHSPSEFLELLERKTGILIQAGRVRHAGETESVYEFRHLTIQEYLAAVALVKGRYPGRRSGLSLARAIAPLAGTTSAENGERTIAENWRETLRLCVSVCEDDDVDAAILAITTPLLGEDAAVRRPRAMLAAECLLDEPNVSDEVVERVLRKLAYVIEADDGRLQEPSALSALVSALGDSRWGALLIDLLVQRFVRADLPERVGVGRMAALAHTGIHACTYVEFRSFLNDVMRHLGRSTKLEVFVHSVLRLASLASSEKAMSFRTRQYSVRSKASFENIAAELAMHVGGYGPEATASLLALRVPFETGGGDSEPAGLDHRLRLLIKGDDPPGHRVLAMEAIQARNSLSHATQQTIRACLDDPDPYIRRLAMRVLRSKGIGPTRLLALADDPSPEVRETAAGFATTIEAIHRYVNDADASVRAAAYGAAATLTQGGRAIMDAAVMSGGADRTMALIALEQRRSNEVSLKTLDHVITTGTPDEQILALRLLPETETPELEATLAHAARSSHAAVRVATAVAVLNRRRAGNARWIDRVLGQLSTDREPDVRAACLSTVRGAPLAALDDPSEIVRARALRLLLEQGQPDYGVQKLTAAFENLRPESIVLAVPSTVDRQRVRWLLGLLPLAASDGRREILGTAVRSKGDTMARLLLSEDFDGFSPFLDPAEPVPGSLLLDMALFSGVSPADVLDKYRRIATWLPIDISEIETAATRWSEMTDA